MGYSGRVKTIGFKVMPCFRVGIGTNKRGIYDAVGINKNCKSSTYADLYGKWRKLLRSYCQFEFGENCMIGTHYLYMYVYKMLLGIKKKHLDLSFKNSSNIYM